MQEEEDKCAKTLIHINEKEWEAMLSLRDRNQKWIRNRFYELDDPGLYLGDEMNTFHYDWDRAVKVGMVDGTFRIVLMNMMASRLTFSAPAMHLFYDLLHRYNTDWVVERSLCPPSKRNQDLMKEDGISPFSVESKMPPPFHYMIPKNMQGKMRHVYSFKGPVKYMLKLVTFALRDYDSLYSEGLYSFRTSRTAHDFLKILRDSDCRHSCYIFKADVSNYIGSIIPEKIIPMLEEIWGHDPALLDLMKFLLLRRECIEPDGKIVSCQPGGLGGIPLANIFMNVYLMELDAYYYRRVPLYARYSDDIIIFANSREEAEAYRDHFLEVLKEKGLVTNKDKTSIIEPGGQVDILGCKLKEGRMGISDHAMKKLKRKIRMHARKLLRFKGETGLSDEECGRRMADYCNRLFFSQNKKNELTWARWFFPVITETASLGEMDHYIQDAIRYCMCGSLSKKRYRIPYQKLKELGYRNLVHAYYHFEH